MVGPNDTSSRSTTAVAWDGKSRANLLAGQSTIVTMSESNVRNVFIVVAGGNAAAERHFEDTIQRKRSLSEVRAFLPDREIQNLERIYHSSDFIVWGAVPGPMNESR